MELIPEPGHLVTLQIVDHTRELSISASSHRDVVNRVDKLWNTRSYRREEIDFFSLKAMKAYMHAFTLLGKMPKKKIFNG